MEMLLSTTLWGSVLILLVLAVRPLLKKAPRQITAGLWLLPFGRLLVPWGGVSVPFPALPQWTLALWLAGIGVLLAYAAGTALYLNTAAGGAVEYEDRVFIRDGIRFPYALGQRICMPFEEDAARRSWLLRQLRRRSTVLSLAVRCAVFAAAAVHWFNPLVWVALIFCRRDWDACHDEAVLRDAGLLPCAVSAPPVWLRLCPWAAFQTGAGSRRAACEAQIASEPRGKHRGAILAALLTVASVLTLVPFKGAETTAKDPVWITGTYYIERDTYRSPLTSALSEDDGRRYDFAGDKLVISDLSTGETVQVVPLAGILWQEFPYTQEQWGRLLWWVDPGELPYLDARYAALGKGMALLETANGLYLVRGTGQGDTLETVNSICVMSAEKELPSLNTALPQGSYVSEKRVAVSPSESLSLAVGNDSGHL